MQALASPPSMISLARNTCMFYAFVLVASLSGRPVNRLAVHRIYCLLARSECGDCHSVRSQAGSTACAETSKPEWPLGFMCPEILSYMQQHAQMKPLGLFTDTR